MDKAPGHVDADQVAPWSGVDPADLDRLLREVELLHERLHRVTVALSLTEDLVADTFERMAAGDGARGTDRLLQVKRARRAAQECRDFAARLADVEPVRHP